MINNIARHFVQAKKDNTRIPLTNVTNVKLQNQQISSINKILEAFFKKFLILISKPVYTNTPNGIKISLLYFQSFSRTRKNKTVLKRKEIKKGEMRPPLSRSRNVHSHVSVSKLRVQKKLSIYSPPPSYTYRFNPFLIVYLP